MRRMSFSLTERQLTDGSKSVTRRLGWRTLKAGDELLAVRKCMGIRKGEHQQVLARVRVKSVRQERLDEITLDEVTAEGFPEMTVTGFVEMFCRAMKCRHYPGCSGAPYVCPGCYAVGEPCAPGCIDAEIERDREERINREGFYSDYYWDDDQADLDDVEDVP
jgi:hypothetical protein